jgi:hypothetical protein
MVNAGVGVDQELVAPLGDRLNPLELPGGGSGELPAPPPAK